MISICKTGLLLLFRAYKRMISPLFCPACRYVPTCSEYAAEAVILYGPLRGTGMAIGRLLRCHPFARGGYDPVIVRENSASASECSAAIETCRH
jgi:putative membrane protein insertion efficiency factor